jgi:hypothetical protein
LLVIVRECENVTKEISSYFNYNKSLIIIIFIIIFLVMFQIPESHMDIISTAFAISSPPTVRQEISDDENDWQEWKIKKENETQKKKCDIPLNSLPDIQSLSYMSDGDKLNVTLWLSKIFSEELLYEDILRNETSSNVSEISSSQPRMIKFVMAIDIVSVLNKEIDYTMELSSHTESDNLIWTQNIYEISLSGNKKLVYTKTFDAFPYNDKNFVVFSIDLKLIGNPDKYKLLSHIIDMYSVKGEDCRIVDTSNWSIIPTPEVNIVPAITKIEMRPPEEKNILVYINTNSDLKSEAVLGVNYTNDEKEEKGEKEVNMTFVDKNITIYPFTNNSAMLNITALEDKLKEPKEIPINIFANISFPQTITNREGDIYYSNKTTSMLESSDLTLTILPPLTFNEQLDNFRQSILPIGQLWALLTPIVLAISGFIGWLIGRSRKRKDRREWWNFK